MTTFSGKLLGGKPIRQATNPMSTPQPTPTQVNDHKQLRTTNFVDSGFSRHSSTAVDAEEQRRENPHFKVEDVR